MADGFRRRAGFTAIVRIPRYEPDLYLKGQYLFEKTISQYLQNDIELPSAVYLSAF